MFAAACCRRVVAALTPSVRVAACVSSGHVFVTVIHLHTSTYLAALLQGACRRPGVDLLDAMAPALPLSRHQRFAATTVPRRLADPVCLFLCRHPFSGAAFAALAGAPTILTPCSLQVLGRSARRTRARLWEVTCQHASACFVLFCVEAQVGLHQVRYVLDEVVYRLGRVVRAVVPQPSHHDHERAVRRAVV